MGTAVRQRDAVCEHRLAGSSKLAVLGLRVGIQLDRITPDHPQENGSHERFHQTSARRPRGRRPPPSRRSSTASTRTGRSTTRTGRTKRWAVRGRPITTPGSPRPAPRRCRASNIPATTRPDAAGATGCIYWHHRATFLTSALEGEDVGFEPVDDGHWVIYLATQPIPGFDERRHRVTPAYERLTAVSPSRSAVSLA